MNPVSNSMLRAGTIIGTHQGKFSIQDLAAHHSLGRKLPHAMAWDVKEQKPVITPLVRVWQAQQSTDVVRVDTNRGLAFHCTPDHCFLVCTYANDMLYEDWVPASQLEPGNILRGWVQQENIALHTIASVKPAGTATVYGIEVKHQDNLVVFHSHKANIHDGVVVRSTT